MANFITILRILIAIVVVCMLFFHTTKIYITATILTAIVIWFDGLDGFIARKFNESSKFGAVLDILGDRIVENIYWITFSTLTWFSIPVWIPLIVVTRGIITDGIRSLALEQGFTAFGSTTMMQSKVGRFIVASNFSRGTYAVAKAFAFVFLIAGTIPQEYQAQNIVFNFGLICAYISVAFCVLRGLPVIIESKRFFEKNDN